MATTRLQLPLRFRTAEYAEGAIEAAALYPIGARVVSGEGGRRYFIAIDTDRPDSVLRYLRNHMLGADWRVVEQSTEQCA